MKKAVYISNKYFSFITVITILVLLLLFVGKISQEFFVVLFMPVAIAMLIIGVMELKKSINDKTNQ